MDGCWNQWRMIHGQATPENLHVELRPKAIASPEDLKTKAFRDLYNIHVSCIKYTYVEDIIQI